MDTASALKMIKDEIKKLDKITGLHGEDLPIEFKDVRSYVGRFCARNKKPEKFQFSSSYYSDEKIPYEDKIDTVRHEYAHYMDFMYNGTIVGHDADWKRYCEIVGAVPSRNVSQLRIDYYNEKNSNEKMMKESIDEYNVGDVVNHSVFGRGTITEIFGEGLHKSAVVSFENKGNKRLAISWIVKNCN